MKILCLLKQVPDPNAVTFTADGKLAPNTARAVNEYDEYGLEAALQVKEAGGDVEIVVLSAGGTAAKDAVSRGLAMGADSGILITVDNKQGQGSLETAKTIAGFARDQSFDLIWLGQESSDSGTGNVGPQLAAQLGLPFVSNVVGFELEGEESALITREIEDGHAQVRVPLPLVLCALSGLDEPRYPSLKGIMAARRKLLEERSASEFETEAGDVTWSDLREEERTISGTIIDDEDPADAARKLVEELRERGLV